jgi:hypothetical protein
MFSDLDDTEEEEGVGDPFTDPGPGELLTPFTMARRERNGAIATEKADMTIHNHVIDISSERTLMEEDTRLLM